MPETNKRRSTATTVLDVVGALLICGGVACIYWPAGVILAGLAALAISWVQSR